MDIYSPPSTAVPHKPHPTQAIVCAVTLRCLQCDKLPRTNSNNEHGICLQGTSRSRTREREILHSQLESINKHPILDKYKVNSFGGGGGWSLYKTSHQLIYVKTQAPPETEK